MKGCHFERLRGATSQQHRSRASPQLLLLNLFFMACEYSLKKLCSIFSVGRSAFPQKNLAHLSEASIFILRNLYQSLLQLY